MCALNWHFEQNYKVMISIHEKGANLYKTKYMINLQKQIVRIRNSGNLRPFFFLKCIVANIFPETNFSLKSELWTWFVSHGFVFEISIGTEFVSIIFYALDRVLLLYVSTDQWHSNNALDLCLLGICKFPQVKIRWE